VAQEHEFMSETNKPDADGADAGKANEVEPAGSKAGGDQIDPPTGPSARKRLIGLLASAFGIFLLLLLAAIGGGLFVIYWPRMVGAGADNSAMAARVAALESRLDQMAADRPPANSDDMLRQLATLKKRLDAEEAQLASADKSAVPSDDAELAALKSAISKNKSDITQINDEVSKLATGAADADVLVQLEAKLKATQDTIGALGDKVNAAAKNSNAAMGKLTQRVATLERTAPPDDLDQKLDNMASKSDVSALGDRVDRLETQDAAGLMRRAASVLALADLVRASEGDKPFANELRALKAVMPAEPEISNLSHYAGAGVPTIPTLAKRFEKRIDLILSAERNAQASNWAERLWGDVVGLISVRRVGDIPGEDTQARVARAEYALRHGDLAAAIHEIDALDKPAKSAAMPWLVDAKARLAVRQDARTLTNRIMSGLAAADAKRKAMGASQSGDRR
jgi:hypothetical protein